MKNLLELRFRLRAEELRALAGEMSVDENRRALLHTAEDYERLAISVELMEVSKRRLANLNARSPDTYLPGFCAEAPAAVHAEKEDQIQIYRDMAADAVALADVADEPSRQGWLSLARTWIGLADKLENTARSADVSKERADTV
jgi:hypothetical protein